MTLDALDAIFTTFPRLETPRLRLRQIQSDDAAAVGACPFHLDPDRRIPDMRTGAPVMGFGDGRHRCPGAFIAMEESAIFLARLLSLPGLRIVGTPDFTWNNLVGGYEFHECIVAVD